MFTNPSPPSLAAQYGRYARVALGGLLAPAIVRAFAAMLGMPLRGAAADALVVLPPALFAVAGVLGLKAAQTATGQAMTPGAWRRQWWWTAVAFAVCGGIVSQAYDSLAGLTGREPFTVVSGIVVAAFALGFGVAAAGTCLSLRLAVSRSRGIVLRSMGGGALGGLLALLPFLAQVAGAAALSSYITLVLAVVAAFGCVIVPFRVIGTALRQG